jgi:4'-phosphopantetheinyl transferase
LHAAGDRRYVVDVTATIEAIARPAAGSVHLWRAAARDDGLLDAGLLSRAERARLARRTGSAAASFVRGHVALRRVAAVYDGCAPEQADLSARYGAAPRTSDLWLSLSRCDHLALVGAAATPLGVDIEPRSAAPVEPDELAELAPATLTAAERAYLASAPNAERPLRWLRMWVRKEAVLKARGARLGEIPMFELDVRGPRLDELAIADLDVGAAHVGAVALTADGAAIEWKELRDVV